MNPFFQGALAGYGIAMPVGAVSILIIGAALRGGFLPGFAAGMGAATADLFFATLAALAGQDLYPVVAGGPIGRPGPGHRFAQPG